MNFNLRAVALVPLRAIGLDPGRALDNAHPSDADKDRDRVEMRRYVFGATAVHGGDGAPSRVAPDRLGRRGGS